MRYELHNGDCLEVMRGMAAESVDAVVTDPPYGLAFMGKAWDKAVPGPEFFAEMLRVAKPGAHLLAFGGTRLFHRMTCAIEDAGWEVRDCLCWLYGSGFPKSLDVSKAIDAHLGAEREVVGKAVSWNRPESKAGDVARMNTSPAEYDITAPATAPATAYAGWGTALKPAWEPIILARKPLIGTVAENVLAHGTGGINVDGCRIPSESIKTTNGKQNAIYGDLSYNAGEQWESNRLGRWPANLVLDAAAGAMLDEQVGDNVSRFMYCPKADSTDRNEGLEGMEASPDAHNLSSNACNRCGKRVKANGSGDKCECGDLRETVQLPKIGNPHPTVKPTDLMRWLVRMVTPPGGIVLDPFMGSGTTGKAAMEEAVRFIGIELDPGYHAIAERRIKHAAAQKRMF